MTIQRIRDYAQQVGYVRNPTASTLRTQRSKEIAVLVPRLSDIVLATVYESIDKRFSAHGYTTSVANTFDDPQRQQKLGELALLKSVDGLIIGDALLTQDSTWLDELAQRGIPYVLVTRRRPGHPSITSNDYLGGQIAAQHLYEQGHRQVALLGGDLRSSPGTDRSRGFFDFFKQQGIEIPQALHVTGLYDVKTGREQGERLLQSGIHFSAVFATNDFLAIGMYGALHARGIQVGKEVAVVGYNDIDLAAQLTPLLTSISTMLSAQGEGAVAMLL